MENTTAIALIIFIVGVFIIVICRVASPDPHKASKRAGQSATCGRGWVNSSELRCRDADRRHQREDEERRIAHKKELEEQEELEYWGGYKPE